jgi:hypothetical protein
MKFYCSKCWRNPCECQMVVAMKPKVRKLVEWLARTSPLWSHRSWRRG